MEHSRGYACLHRVCSLCVCVSLLFDIIIILKWFCFMLLVHLMTNPLKGMDDGPLGTELFEKEQDNLLSDLKDIPKKSCDSIVSFFHLRSLQKFG